MHGFLRRGISQTDKDHGYAGLWEWSRLAHPVNTGQGLSMRIVYPYAMATGSKLEHHNASLEPHAITNNDPALDISHEHHHDHLHHDANAERGREDEVVYSKGTTFEPSTIPEQDPQDNDLHRRKYDDITKAVMQAKAPVDVVDQEKSEFSSTPSGEDPQHHRLSNCYRRYRIFVHLFLWVFFTA